MRNYSLPLAVLDVNYQNGTPPRASCSFTPGHPLRLSVECTGPSLVLPTLSYLPLTHYVPVGGPDDGPLSLAWLASLYPECTEEFLIATFGLTCAPTHPHVCPGEACRLLHVASNTPSASGATTWAERVSASPVPARPCASPVAPRPCASPASSAGGEPGDSFARFMAKLPRLQGIPAQLDVANEKALNLVRNTIRGLSEDEVREVLRRWVAARRGGAEGFVATVVTLDLPIHDGGPPARTVLAPAIQACQDMWPSAGWDVIGRKCYGKINPRDPALQALPTSMRRSKWYSGSL